MHVELRIDTPDANVPFILHYHIITESSNISDQNLQVLLCLNQLTALESDMVPTNAVYKLARHGCLATISGTSDRDHPYHLITFAVCKGKNYRSNVFSSSKKTVICKTFLFLRNYLSNYLLVWESNLSSCILFFHRVNKLHPNLHHCIIY